MRYTGAMDQLALVIVWFLVPAALPILGAVFRAIASTFPTLGGLARR
jgi:hypothetical protein